MTVVEDVETGSAERPAPADPHGAMASRVLGEQQSALIAMLPDRPNERLVYSCESKRAGGVGGALGAAFDEEFGTGD